MAEIMKKKNKKCAVSTDTIQFPQSPTPQPLGFFCHVKKLSDACEALRQPNVIPKMKTKVGGKRPFLSILGQTSQEGTDRGLTSPPPHTHAQRQEKTHL